MVFITHVCGSDQSTIISLLFSKIIVYCLCYNIPYNATTLVAQRSATCFCEGRAKALTLYKIIFHHTSSVCPNTDSQSCYSGWRCKMVSNVVVLWQVLSTMSNKWFALLHIVAVLL